MKSTGSPIIDAYLDRYGKTMPIDIALVIAKKHGISKDEVVADHHGITVSVKDFFMWLGY